MSEGLFVRSEGLEGGVYTMRCAAPLPKDLVDAVRANLGRVGGELGWYGMPLAWRLRLRLGRFFGERLSLRRPGRIERGAQVDWWTVTRADGDHLVLAATDWFCGEGWLGYRIASSPPRFEQVAAFRPKGLLGLAYWRLLWPVHWVVFRIMARGQLHHARSRRVVRRSRAPRSRGMTPVILWFRRDLRLDDLPALHACAGADAVVPLFVVDPAAAPRCWTQPPALPGRRAPCARRGAGRLLGGAPWRSAPGGPTGGCGCTRFAGGGYRRFRSLRRTPRPRCGSGPECRRPEPARRRLAVRRRAGHRARQVRRSAPGFQRLPKSLGGSRVDPLGADAVDPVRRGARRRHRGGHRDGNRKGEPVGPSRVVGGPPARTGRAAAAGRPGGGQGSARTVRGRPAGGVRRGPGSTGGRWHLGPVALPAFRVHTSPHRARATGDGEQCRPDAQRAGVEGVLRRPPLAPARCCPATVAGLRQPSALGHRGAGPGPVPGLGHRTDRLSAGRRRDAPVAGRGVDAQSRAHGDGELPGEGSAHRLAPRGTLVHVAPGRRRPGLQPTELAVGGRRRHRCRPVPPGVQPPSPAGALRSRRWLRSPLPRGAPGAPRSMASQTGCHRPETSSRSSTTHTSGARRWRGLTKRAGWRRWNRAGAGDDETHRRDHRLDGGG